MVHSDVFDLKRSGEIVAIARWQGAGTGGIATLKALAVAIVRTRLWKPPVTRDRRIHEQVQRLARNFRLHNIKTVTKDTENKIAICKPFHISSRPIGIRWFPFNAVNMALVVM